MEVNQYENLINKMNEVLRSQNGYQVLEKKIDTAISSISDIKIMQQEFASSLDHLEDRTNRYSSRQELFEEKVDRAISKLNEVQAQDRLRYSENLNNKIGTVKEEISNIKGKTMGMNGALSVVLFWVQQSIISLMSGHK